MSDFLSHEYLIHTQIDTQIESYEYLNKIIFEIEATHDTKELEIIKDIDYYLLDIDTAMSLGVIINEVLTNAIKYHNPIQKCHIKLSFKRDKEKMILIIADDGYGFDIDKIDKGFGLKMIEEFASKLDKNSIKYNFHYGTEFVLYFKR